MTAGRVVPVGDATVTLAFDAVIDPVVNARCIAAAARLRAIGVEGVRDVVPAYQAVTIHFDPVRTDRERLMREIAALADAPDAGEALAAIVEIPTRYGGADGPDLADVAAFAGCSADEVVRRHSGTVYRVYMLGFLPGFAYMGSVDPAIAMPRLDSPRAHVAAGSVGIAGAQTGIYPCDTPGGWRIIGRADAVLFDAAREQPCLLKAGDRVRFVPA